MKTIDSIKFEKMIKEQGFKRLINKVVKDTGYDITTWHPSGRIAGMSHPSSGFEVKINYDGEYSITNWIREYQNPNTANERLMKALNEVNILNARIEKDSTIFIEIKYELLGMATLQNIHKDLKDKYTALKEAASDQYIKSNKLGVKGLRRFAIQLDHRAEIIRTKLSPIEKVLGIE